MLIYLLFSSRSCQFSLSAQQAAGQFCLVMMAARDTRSPPRRAGFCIRSNWPSRMPVISSWPGVTARYTQVMRLRLPRWRKRSTRKMSVGFPGKLPARHLLPSLCHHLHRCHLIPALPSRLLSASCPGSVCSEEAALWRAAALHWIIESAGTDRRGLSACREGGGGGGKGMKGHKGGLSPLHVWSWGRIHGRGSGGGQRGYIGGAPAWKEEMAVRSEKEREEREGREGERAGKHRVTWPSGYPWAELVTWLTGNAPCCMRAIPRSDVSVCETIPPVLVLSTDRIHVTLIHHIVGELSLFYFKKYWFIIQN